MDPDGGFPRPLDHSPERSHKFEKGLDITDSRDVLQDDRLSSQESGSNAGEGGVLVPRRANGSGEGVSPLHDK
jgi:hypothetical protein